MKYLTYTTWHRDRGGKLVLRQKRYRVIGRSHVVERGLAMRASAVDMLTAGILFFAVITIALNVGCASADGSPPPPEEPSPEAQPDSLPVDVVAEAPPLERNWCCAAERFGTPVLACGYSVRPSYAQECYCSGIVSADTETCRDNTAWTPGTFCTRADLVCLEGE